MSYPNNTNLFTQPQQPQQQAGGHVPSNQAAINQLDKAAHALNGVQTSNSAQQLGPSGQRVVQDVQQLLNDQKNIIAHRNEGDALQKVIHDAQVLGQKLGGKVEGGDVSMFKSLINDWKNIFTSVAGGDEAKDMANTGSSLLRGLADTEEFLDLVSELINLAKLLISQTDAQITKDNTSNTDFKHELDQEREVVMEKLNATLNTLAANDLWTHLVQQGRSVAQKSAHQVQGAAHDAHNAVQNAAPQVQGNIWELLDSQEMQTFTEDLKMFLQRLVGDEHDVTPLFEYTKAALRDIKNDPELHKAVHAAEDTLHSVSATANDAIQDPNVNHAANPAYNAMTEYLNKQPAYAAPSNDIQRHAEEAQQHLKTVGKNLEAAMNNIKNNENLRKAREEAHVLREAFLNDPDNRQLINDARQLWHDLQSPSGGLDPALLIGLREAVVPIVLDHFNNVPIPTIHNTISMLGKMNFTIDGIRLSIPQILPDNLYVRFEYELDTTIRSLDVHAQRLFMHLELRNMHMHLRDVAWAYQRLSAPRKSDSGHLDLDTLGDGITIKLKIQMHTDNSVEVKESQVNIQKFKTTFRDSKHNKMYSGLAHVFAHQIKKNVQKSVEAKMKEMGSQVGGKLMQTVGDLRSKSTGLLGQTNSKKQQVFEMLRNKRGQHQPKEGQGMKVRAQQVRQNHLFQSAVHKAAGSATSALDEQQRRVEERKEQAHVNKAEQQRMDNATAASHGLAPTLPSTNRPDEAPVPAMMFIPDVGGNINTAPITSGHGLTHVNPNNSIDNRPITDAAHHSVDPEIQRVLEQKLHLNQQQQHQQM